MRHDIEVHKNSLHAAMPYLSGNYKNTPKQIMHGSCKHMSDIVHPFVQDTSQCIAKSIKYLVEPTNKSMCVYDTQECCRTPTPTPYSFMYMCTATREPCG